MNTYTYKCLDCENIFDIQATIQEKEENKGEKFICSKCQSRNLKQKNSAGNFIKNIFKSDGNAGGCCSGGNVCDISCKSDENKKDNCGRGNSNGSCCG